MSELPAHPHTRQTAAKWNEHEDSLLREVITAHGARNWKEIASKIPGRTHVQCLQRWNKVLKPGLKKGSWEKEEDLVLNAKVDSFYEQGAEPNWTQICRFIVGRTAKQCRERWRCNLDPLIKKCEWTPEEDVMILNMQQAMGNRWALLAKQLQGRTENAIKTRFRSLQRSMKRKWTQAEDERIISGVKNGQVFADIALDMPRRSINAIRVRFKALCGGGSGGSDSESAQSMVDNQNNSPPLPPPPPPPQLPLTTTPSSSSNLLLLEQQHHHLEGHNNINKQTLPVAPLFPPLCFGLPTFDLPAVVSNQSSTSSPQPVLNSGFLPIVVAPGISGEHHHHLEELDPIL